MSSRFGRDFTSRGYLDNFFKISCLWLIFAEGIEDGSYVPGSCNKLPLSPAELKASPAVVPSSNPI